MAKEKQAGKQSREVKYCGTIPKEVVKDMPPEIRIQYFFWDALLKRQIQLHPGMFPPLVKEIFGKEYPGYLSYGVPDETRRGYCGQDVRI